MLNSGGGMGIVRFATPRLGHPARWATMLRVISQMKKPKKSKPLVPAQGSFIMPSSIL